MSRTPPNASAISSAGCRYSPTVPLTGRPVEGGKRELVIGHGARGYVALYRHVPELDTVFLLAIRTQREAGYKHKA
jgi:hypothetical protein